MGMEVYCHCQRLLSPFRGIEATIECRSGVAESCDGQLWTLWVTDPALVSHTGLGEVRFGTWSQSGGGVRARVRGGTDSGLIERCGQELLENVIKNSTNLPFPASDLFEYWLLDGKEGMPLALIDSRPTRPADWTNSTVPATFRAGARAHQSFISTHGDAATVESLIAEVAGPSPRCRWFRRDDQGNRVDDRGEHWPSLLFPPLLLRETWPDERHRALVADLLAWQAPWLLQLDTINDERRRQLEQAAWHNPLQVERGHRLYPRILDQNGLTATRVKARLIGLDQEQEQPPPEPFMPDYEN
jgi:hypothetical protein